MTECVEANETPLKKHTTLVNDYNALLEKHRQLAADFDESVEAATLLKSRYEDAQSSLDDIETCLMTASTIDEARLCAQ